MICRTRPSRRNEELVRFEQALRHLARVRPDMSSNERELRAAELAKVSAC